MVQELLNGWQKGAHGYISEVNEDNVIRLVCENVNSLSIFHPTKSKMHKLTHLHQRHQTDGACIVEHGINFKMAATGTRLEELSTEMYSRRVSASHNIHELHNRYQQGGTMTVAFSRLESYVISSGVDQTGLCCWSWFQVRTGEHWTQIVLTYQPCRLSACRPIGHNGLRKGRGMVAAQHKCYFQKKSDFNKPWKIFSSQLITQLRAWCAVGEEEILFIDVNKNVYTGPLAKATRQRATDGGADPLFNWERGTTQSLHWEGGNSGHVHYSGYNLHEFISLSPWCRG